MNNIRVRNVYFETGQTRHRVAARAFEACRKCEGDGWIVEIAIDNQWLRLDYQNRIADSGKIYYEGIHYTTKNGEMYSI